MTSTFSEGSIPEAKDPTASQDTSGAIVVEGKALKKNTDSLFH